MKQIIAVSISLMAAAATIGLVDHEIATRGPWTGIAVGFGIIVFCIFLLNIFKIKL